MILTFLKASLCFAADVLFFLRRGGGGGGAGVSVEDTSCSNSPVVKVSMSRSSKSSSFASATRSMRASSRIPSSCVSTRPGVTGPSGLRCILENCAGKKDCIREKKLFTRRVQRTVPLNNVWWMWNRRVCEQWYP